MALRQFAPCPQINRKPTAAEQEELDALDRRAAELEQQAQASFAGVRVADFSAADNPRRAQWQLEKLNAGRAVKGD